MYLPLSPDGPTPDQLVRQLRDHPNNAPDTLWLLYVADRHGDRIPDILEASRAAGLRVCGGIFPGLIHGDALLQEGLLAQPLPRDSQAAVAAMAPSGPVWRAPLPRPPADGRASALILVDSQAPNIAGLLEAVYDQYGNAMHHAGAGAGYRDLRPSPTLFTEVGLIPHGALLILIPRRATVRVRHGWSRVRGPFVASRTRGNLIQEFNWEPAGPFYLAQVEGLDPNLCGRPVFPDLSSAYPLCIGKEGGEDVMRDPIRITPEGEIEVLSDVSENSVMYLAHGNDDTLMQASREAVEECGAHGDVAACFVSDCYSRAIRLGEAFPRELCGVNEALMRIAGIPAEGVLALGEIAANGRRGLEFYNKTFVVALRHH